MLEDREDGEKSNKTQHCSVFFRKTEQNWECGTSKN
jgi:hypothetical protein